jgi:ADP-ribose pyrophosphatase YjhB (NUDIX family)
MELKKYVGVLVKNGDKCLLCKRNAEGSFPGMWSLPAGKIEKNENSRDAAVREFKEETDIDLERKNLEFVGLLPRISRDNSKIKGYMYVYEYFTEVPLIPDLENAVDGEEHTECGYFKVSQILKMETGEHLKKFFKNILSK